MSLIKTDRNKFSKTLKQAIAELKEAVSRGDWTATNRYFKLYEGIKGMGPRGSKGTFQIAALSESAGSGKLSIHVALASFDAQAEEVFIETDVTRLAKELCLKHNARISHYGGSSKQARDEPFCWLILAEWGK